MAMEQAREAALAVSEFFQGNPFGTQVGKMIEQATESNLPSENWALNMEICDAINTLADGPRDAVRAIRKRLQVAMGKNNTTVVYTLTVLETCVKNCDARFHHLITQKEFVQDLVKLIGPKFDPPQVIQEKVLQLIQSWSDAFRGHAEYKGVCEIYDDLKAKGVEFPMTDLDALAPIITPQRSFPEPVAPPPQPRQQISPHPQQQLPQQQQQQQIHHVPSGTINPSPDQLAKLRSELDVVNGNVKVLREMLAELHPGKEDPEDFQLLQQLFQTCKSMQQRVVELLQRVANEEVTSELLLINDEMNNVFAKYERYISNRQQPESVKTSAAGGAAASAAVKPSGGHPHQEPETSLIDFGSDSSSAPNQAHDLSSQLAGMSVGAKSKISDVPQVSMSHAHPGAVKPPTSTYDDNTKIDQLNVGLGTAAQQRGQSYGDNAVLDRERELAEMEAWLKANPGAKVPNAEETSDEFNQFLAQRAKAAENLPKAATDKSEEDKMFGL